MRAPLRNVAVVEDPSPAEAPIMLPTEDLFVHVYVLIDDAIAAGEVTIPARPGPTPACSDAELLTHRPGAPSAGPAQRGRIRGRGDPRLGAAVSPAAAPVPGQPAHPLAMGRLRAAARRARGRMPGR